MRKTNGHIFRMLLGCAAGLCLVGAAAWSDSVSASAEGGYGRLVLSLDSGRVQARVAGSVLVLSFPQKTNLTPAQIAAILPGYVSNGRADADGKTLRFALGRTFRLHTSSQGGRVAVDLVPADFKGDPPALSGPPKAPPPPPVDMNNLEALKVRSGAYQNFSRIVFDWNREVPYTVSGSKGRLTVRFSAPVKPDFSPIERQLPPWVKPAGSHIEGRTTVVDFTTDSDSAGFHDFRDGTHVVVDVLAPRTDAQLYRPPGTARPTVTAFSGEGGGRSAPPPAVPAKPFGKAAEKASAPDLNTAQARAVADAAGRLNHPQSLPQVILTDAAVPKPVSGTQAVTVQHNRDGAVLDMPGSGGHAAAVFVRGMTAWVILQSSPSFDASALKDPLRDIAESVDAVSGSGVSILRVILKRPLKVAAVNAGDHLRVVFSPVASSAVANVRFNRDQDDAAHATLSAALPGAGRVVVLNDPVVKDKIFAVPGTIGQAVSSEHRFVEFTLLPTAVGIALVPAADDVSMIAAGTQVTISRPFGLVLSQNTASNTDMPGEATGERPDSFLDYARWARFSAGSFLATERALRARAVGASSQNVTSARIDLARFYLANDFGAEALGLLNVLQQSSSLLQSSSQLQIMRAAAEYQMGRLRDAHNALSDASFDSDRHAALWRGLIDAALENSMSASNNLERAMPILGMYRPDIQVKARLAAAESALALGHVDDARKYLAQLPSELPEALKAKADLVRARFYAAQNDKRTSDALFASVERNGDARTAALAVYYRVDSGLQSGRMSDGDAINALERLRYRWRGDGLELRTLNQLSKLYLKQKRWRDALGILHVVARYFPAADAGLKAEDQMRGVFYELFQRGKADSMPPADALGLFYDYIDLTPIGPDGDEMIRHMADRLTNVDLLGPASDLLRYQIDNRLNGMARAQVATRLAAVQLMDRKPQAALETLLTTQISAMPDDVARQRVLLQARALTDLKRWEEALDLIADDKSPEAARFRADIYWRSGSWSAAAPASEAILGNRWNDPAPLSDDERQQVMHAAVAYALAGDISSLDRVRARYSVKMKDTPDGAGFAVVTSRDDIRGLAFRDAAAKVARVDMLQTFMKDLQTKR